MCALTQDRHQLTVDLYTRPNCPPCKLTKKVLDTEGIAYRERPAADHGEYLNNLGYLQAPVVVAGDTHWSGFSPDKLRMLR